MTFAEVFHYADPDRKFWFEVPVLLQILIHVDDNVLCNTSKGLYHGRVTKVLEGLSDEEFEDAFGFLPTAEIVGVHKDIPMSEIEIPMVYGSSLPHAGKISKRVNELYAGHFKTRIEVDPGFTMKDGYTAYLVARMFDLDTLPCLVSIGDESVYKTYGKKEEAADGQ